ncbi:MAG: tetratricopeptide repeat protein [Candidatus Omnitrophica bacterium]|nr:tetratricopeptide repeat protein [Candidatus Omnitrophota bacterium]
MLKKLIIMAALLFCFSLSSYALDWKAIHEKSDSLNSSQAQKIYEKNQNSLENLYILGLAYLNEYKNMEAEDVFYKMLKLDPDSKEAQWGKAEISRRKRDHKSSKEILEQLIDKYPEYVPVSISLAYIRYIDKNFDATVDLAYKVVKMGQDKVDLNNFVRAHCLVAGAKGMIAHYGGPLSKVVNGRSVLPYLKKAEKLRPDSPAVLFGLGSYYLLIPAVFGRDIDKAEQYLLKAIKIDPNFADIYVRLAQVEKFRKNYDKYNEYLSKALSLDPLNELARDISQGKCEFVCLAHDK